MQNYIEIPNSSISEHFQINSSENDDPIRSKVNICNQHQFTSPIPITSLNIYFKEMFCSVVRVLSPMSLVDCEHCGMKFISVMENTAIIDGKSSNFERTFAAYYNTSQLSGSARSLT
jgi:hypothetical protein